MLFVNAFSPVSWQLDVLSRPHRSGESPELVWQSPNRQSGPEDGNRRRRIADERLEVAQRSALHEMTLSARPRINRNQAS